MKTVTREYKVYSYSELSEEAKEKVKRWYLCGRDAEDFTSILMEDLKDLFSNSDLKLQYSLSYCRGDGLNIYGKLDLMDVLLMVKENKAGDYMAKLENTLTENEIKTIKAYINVCGSEIELPYNKTGYYYCVADRTNFSEEWIEKLKYQMYKNIKVNTIRKLENIVIFMFEILASHYEKYGYDYFYKVDEKSMIEFFEDNGWVFLEDGTFFPE